MLPLTGSLSALQTVDLSLTTGNTLTYGGAATYTLTVEPTRLPSTNPAISAGLFVTTSLGGKSTPLALTAAQVKSAGTCTNNI